MFNYAKIVLVLSQAFACLGAISALLLGASFTKRQCQRYPVLKKLDGKQLYLFAITVVLFACAYGGNVWKDILSVQTSEEATQSQLNRNLLAYNLGFHIGMLEVTDIGPALQDITEEWRIKSKKSIKREREIINSYLTDLGIHVDTKNLEIEDILSTATRRLRERSDVLEDLCELGHWLYYFTTSRKLKISGAFAEGKSDPAWETNIIRLTTAVPKEIKELRDSFFEALRQPDLDELEIFEIWQSTHQEITKSIKKPNN